MKITAHNFPKEMDNAGGSAFRHWSMLFYYKGVFVGFENHDEVSYALTNPKSKWRRGSQDSCLNDNPMPRPENGELVKIDRLPGKALDIAKIYAQEAWRLVSIKVEENRIKKLNIEEKKEKERLLKMQKIESTWINLKELESSPIQNQTKG
jgi:hypothetical protein